MTVYLGDKLIAGSFKAGASWEVGDVGISAFGIDEALNKRRYLNGQVISQAQFVEFTAMLKSRVSVYPSLATTEVNWQAEVTNSKLGQCGKFVIDDDAGTIRLPKVVNINGLQDLTGLGEIKAESLPNITGRLLDNRLNMALDGAFYSTSGAGGTGTGSNATTPSSWYFDASRSSSTYQDDAPVQQEAVQYPYFIQVAEGVETSVDVSREIELNNPFSLLDYKYSEYELSNASWLLSNGQFNSGVTYSAVYNLLLQIYNGTVTKAGVSVKLSTEAYADTDFVLNTGDTTFRLPTVVKLASGKAVAGNGMSLGLTNSIQDGGLVVSDIPNGVGALRLNTTAYGQNVGYIFGTSTNPSNLATGVTTDETKSGIETSANGLYLYFYVGEVVQDANIIAAAGVLTDVADLKNASNFSSLGKETVVGWGMPNYSAAVSKVSLWGTDITATENGYVWVTDNNTAGTGVTFSIGAMGYLVCNSGTTPAGCGGGSLFPVSAGDVYKASGGNGAARQLIFIPMRGV